MSNRTSHTQTGIYHATERAFGFITPSEPDGHEGDYFVPPKLENGAWNGDTVTFALDSDPTAPGQRQEAKVTGIVQRANRTVTGAVRRHNRETWLVPDSPKLKEAILLVGKLTGLHAGDKAAVKLSSYGTDRQPPMASLLEVLGRDGTREAAVEAVLFDQDIHRPFPSDVLEQTQRVPHSVLDTDLPGRLDLRDRFLFTIDGEGAKDLDDAVSLERDEQGRYVLGVHIADVSHYVPLGSPLDVEAWQRGTSVYFADQVIPMLPPALSNGICSLNPQEDRLALSCLMTFEADGTLADHTLARSVIRSSERMNYNDCNHLLAGDDPGLERRYARVLPVLKDMADLDRALRRVRKRRGSLDLASRETQILCDEEGFPVAIASRESGESEGIIESFMLAANECVAQHLCAAQQPAIYRIHEKPYEEKVEALRSILAPLGFTLKDASGFSLQKLLDETRDTPQEYLVHTAVLRSLAKARYEHQNFGHFGLAAEFYCHFTAPIRRYPDLMVHRAVTALLSGEPMGRKLAAAMPKAALQSSQRELAAQTAEREIEKHYVAEFMSAHVGEHFDAVVSGVTRFGLFVMAAVGVEGFLPVEALPARYYTYDESHLTLSADNGAEVYTLGTQLEVLCAAADPGSGQIDFRLPGTPHSAQRRSGFRERDREERPAQRRVGKRPGQSHHRPPHGPHGKKGRGRR